MEKYKVAIVSTGSILDTILLAIDLDNIEICAVYGLWESMSPLSKKIFKDVFQPLDMLSVNCNNLGGGVFSS